jgi:hypothetical protein
MGDSEGGAGVNEGPKILPGTGRGTSRTLVERACVRALRPAAAPLHRRRYASAVPLPVAGRISA